MPRNEYDPHSAYVDTETTMRPNPENKSQYIVEMTDKCGSRLKVICKDKKTAQREININNDY